jgi:DNA/RNA endonuclease YhcR with UshA esterase domain
LNELPKNHRHKTKRNVFAFTTLILATTFWLKDNTGGDGSVRVVGHSFAMDAPSTTSVASAIALSDKDVRNVNKSNNDGSGLLLSSSASCY